jgi:HSP20 family protein
MGFLVERKGSRGKEVKDMAGKVTGELARTERSGSMLSPFEEVERWFNEAWTSPFSLLRRRTLPMFGAAGFEDLTPSVDMYEEGKDLVMKTDMPGVKKEDVHIDLSENVLTISGEKKMEETVEKGGLYRCERSYGRFSRSFELPFDVEREKITASLKEGVLEIRLPKSERAEKEIKTISIN